MADSDERPLYAVLCVAPDASPEEVKKAYRKLALESHPDRCRGSSAELEDATARFARVAIAYEVLGHEQRRKRYDLTGEVPQSDAATRKAAGETFLQEYVRSAPKTAKSVTNKEMSLHSLENYEHLDVDGKDVPEYIRGIVMIGLGYLVEVAGDMAEKEVVLLRHFVMDQMYALMAYTPPLDENAFKESGYIITYFDSPLQSGIQPTWSDQNRSGASLQRSGGPSKTIDEETMDRRRLAALTYLDADGKMMPAGGDAGQRKDDDSTVVPGEGCDRERVRLAACVLVKREPDIGSYSISKLRRALEPILGLEEGAMDSFSGLPSLILQVVDEVGCES